MDGIGTAGCRKAGPWAGIALAWLALTPFPVSAAGDGGNWLQLERLNDESRQRLLIQQQSGIRETPRAGPGKQAQPLANENRDLPPEPPQEPLFHQQQLQQKALQEQQRRTLITGQHRQQAVDDGRGIRDNGAIQQQQFRMQQQNQLRSFQLQQQIQQGIRR